MTVELRVRVYATDGELRTWLADELALMSPTIDVQTLDDIRQLDPGTSDLVLAGIDTLSSADSERLREVVERHAAPVIAIGTPPPALRGVPFACVLDATLTSKQLKRAVRECLARPAPAVAAHRDA